MLILIPTLDATNGHDTGERAASLAGMDCDWKLQVDNEGKGFVKTVNAGLAGVTDHVCLLNDDCVPEADGWLATLYAKMRKRESLNVWFAGPSGSCRTPPQNGGRVGDKRRPRIVDHLAGFCLLIHKDALKEMGGLDEQYIHYAAEVDYQWRARRDHGAYSLWVPEVYMEHEVHDPHHEWWVQDQQKLSELW